jgi:hypothetical protein
MLELHDNVKAYNMICTPYNFVYAINITTREGTPMPVPQPEEVMELAVELKEARNRLAELESRWESFFSRHGENVVAVPVQNLKPRIIQFLEARPDMSFNLTSVASALGANENSVGPYLSDLAKEEKIERRDRGLYGALRPKPSDGIKDEDIPF